MKRRTERRVRIDRRRMGISEERVLPEQETGRQFHGRGRKEDKAIAIFREDGTYRYYDFPPEEYYDGTYSYDEMSGVLTTDDGVNEQTCLTEITRLDDEMDLRRRRRRGARRILFTEVIGCRNSRLSGREHRPDFFTDKHFLCTEQSLPISGKSENGVSFFGQMFTYIPEFRK